MPAGRILLFGLLVLGVLLAVFPGQHLQRRLDTSAFSDSLSMAYLQAWMQAEPDNARLRLILARRQAVQGDLAAASQTLRPLLIDASVDGYYHNDAEALQLDLLLQAFWRQAPMTAGQAQARAAVLRQLEHMAELDWEPDQLEGLAREAMALGAPDQALRLLQRLLETQPYESAQVRNDIAALQLAQGHYREAAATHFMAMEAAGSVDLRRQHFLAGLRALQSGNLLDEAMAQAQARWQPLADDAETLEFLARLARAANRLDLAEQYVSRLLRQRVGVLP